MKKSKNVTPIEASETAEARLLRYCIRTNQRHLRSVMSSQSIQTNMAIRSLLGPTVTPQIEAAARVAVVLTLGNPQDRLLLRSILETCGPQSPNLLESSATALGVIRHPVAAYLLLPLLSCPNASVRKISYRSLLTRDQKGIGESLLAVLKTDRSLASEFVRVVKHQTQKEWSRLYDELKQASVSHPQLEEIFGAVHELQSANNLRLRKEVLSGHSITIQRLNKSLNSVSIPVEPVVSDCVSYRRHAFLLEEMTKPTQLMESHTTGTKTLTPEPSLCNKSTARTDAVHPIRSSRRRYPPQLRSALALVAAAILGGVITNSMDSMSRASSSFENSKSQQTHSGIAPNPEPSSLSADGGAAGKSRDSNQNQTTLVETPRSTF